MRTPMVAGNWKLNGTRASAVALASDIDKGSSVSAVEILICPVYVHLSDVAEVVTSSVVKLGAQNAAVEKEGAFTGEVAANMLSEFGCEYVILGHSERRSMFGDTDALVAQKFVSVQAASLTPVLCVGETLDEREAGDAEKIIGAQLDAVIEVAGIAAFVNSVVAYEPVWAIGTGKTASPQQAQDVHSFIREKLAALDSGVAESLRVIYGGSVKPGNAEELFGMADIDGGLIGGAALNSEDFLAICAAASAG